MNQIINTLNYDLNRMSAVDLISVIHIDDHNTRFIELSLSDGGSPFSVTGSTVIARFATAQGVLLSDNVSCTVTNDGKILIPIDAAAVNSVACDLKIEVNITQGTDVLTLPFPLWVRVRGSILETSGISPESQGTIPDLLHQVEEELQRVQGFTDEEEVYEILDNTLSGNRNISPTLLVDRVTDQTYNPNGDLILYYIDSDDVRHNIFNFSPYLGTKDYNALQNRPVVTGRDVSTGVNTVLEGYMNFSSDGFTVQTYQDPDKEIDIELSQNVPICKTGSNDWAGRYDFDEITNVFARSGVFKVSPERALNVPTALEGITREVFYVIHLATMADNVSIIRYAIGYDDYALRGFMQTATLHRNNAFSYDVDYQSDWTEIGAKVSSAVVNQNGTITFTLDDGSTFTTTGSSVIGSDGFSPTVSTTSEYLRTRVEITDVNGTHNFFVNDGESVKSAVIDANGDLIITIKGKPTSGVHPTYPERIYNVGHVVGADGYSPTATVTQTQNGATVSITDKNGTTTANISNGADGSDYILTAQDKSDIADLVLAELPTTQGVQYGNANN